MRTAGRILVLACVLAAGTASAGGLTVDPSRPLPAVRDGRLAELLAQRRNACVVLNFWASWCAPCRDEMPALERLGERWRTRGLSVLTVAVADSHDRASKFLWDAGVSLPMIEDPDQSMSRALGVRALPTTLILDRNHRVAARVRGSIDWDAPAVDKQLQDLLK